MGFVYYGGRRLAAYFNLPHIVMKEVVEEFVNLQTEDGEALRGQLEELKATMVEEAQAAYEIEKKKRKTLGLPYVPFNEGAIQPRLNDEQLHQAFKWRLQQNDCQNRGYVLDGFPKSYANAKGVFLSKECDALW